ncbi:MAG: T9SS type A sorting domain-containing protein [Bacteroidetes bacterium]|nr:T9SS type A sorting domain-containing protein [Bacteroidota bacterium]
MKKQTIKLAALALLLAANTKQHVNAQATVAWRNVFDATPYTQNEEERVASNGVLDTLSNQIYRYSSDEYDESFTIINFDVDPSAGKAIREGYTIAAYDANSGKYKWANELKGFNQWGTPIIEDIEAIGAQKGLYVSASFSGKISYGTKVFNGTFNPTLHSSNPDDILLMKIDEKGILLKSAVIKPIGNVTNQSRIYSSQIAVDPNGNLLVVFEAESCKLDLDPGAGVKSVTALDGEVFMVKYDKNLNYLNHNKIVSNSLSLHIQDVSFDASKNIILKASASQDGGTFTVDLDSKQSGMQSLPAVNYELHNQSVILIKYSANMNYSWSNILKHSETEPMYMFNKTKMKVDNMGNIYIAGLLEQGEYFQYNGTTSINNATNMLIMYVAKYNKQGAYLGMYQEQKPLLVGTSGEFDFTIDSRRNIYYTVFFDNSLYMFKLKTNSTTNSFAQIWKNRISPTVGSLNQDTWMFGLTALANKNSFYLLSAMTVGVHYKEAAILSNNQFGVAAAQFTDYKDVMIKYTLSGSALSPEDQTEENNSIAYKTVVEEATTNVAIYPNPATDFVTIKVESTENTTATIYNYSGVAVKTIALAETETKVNISELPAGMYFVEVVSNGNKEVKKVIKQ